MLDTTPSVMTVTTSGFPADVVPKEIFSTTGVTSTPGSVTPVTIDVTFTTPQPPRVTDIVFTVVNGKNIQVTFTDKDGSKTTTVGSSLPEYILLIGS